MEKILLKTRPKNNHSCIIELDEEIRGTLPLRILRKYSLDNYMETSIGNETAEKLEEEIVISGWKRFINWLAHQERTEGEGMIYLSKLPLAKDISKKLVARAKEEDFINDNRVAELMISILIDKGKSRKEIMGKLYEKRLTDELINANMSKYYGEEVELEVLDKQVTKLLNRWDKVEPDHRVRKVCNHLANKGFNFREVEKLCSKYVSD